MELKEDAHNCRKVAQTAGVHFLQASQNWNNCALTVIKTECRVKISCSKIENILRLTS